MREELEQQSSEIASDLSVWRSFIEHAGWAMLKQVIEGQLNVRDAELLAPLANLDAALAQEFMKGERAFGMLILRMPSVEMERLEAEALTVQEEIENETSMEQSELARSAGDGRGFGLDSGNRDILDLERDPFSAP